MRGIYRSPANSPHKGQWRGALMFSLICAWTNSWTNKGDAGDLRGHRTHDDVTVTYLNYSHSVRHCCPAQMYNTVQGQLPVEIYSYLNRPHFYQTRSAWSVDQGSNKNHSPAYNFTPTVTKVCVMWEGLSLPHDTKFGNCRCKIVDSRSFPSWSLIHGLRWSGLIKVGPGLAMPLAPAIDEL